MTIEEYKKKLVSVVENMECEHGCDIVRINIGSTFVNIGTKVKKFNVEIEM